ncbi:MAG: hypothetical protein KDN20_09440 [Verrucomicrobiae bacterium]|nr:hypothetical protein [Verrucomicrobiae bacterium]
MQQTPLDRWLRRKFIYITRVYCNTLPGDLPPGLTVEEAPEESGGRYLYKMTVSNDAVLKAVVEELQSRNITYTSRVEDRNVWYGKFLNNPHKSFTYRCTWIMIGMTGLIFAISGAPGKIWDSLADEEVEEEVVAESQDENVKIFQKRETLIEIDSVK